MVVHLQLVIIVESSADDQKLEFLKLGKGEGAFASDFHRESETESIIAQNGPRAKPGNPSVWGGYPPIEVKNLR